MFLPATSFVDCPSCGIPTATAAVDERHDAFRSQLNVLLRSDDPSNILSEIISLEDQLVYLNSGISKLKRLSGKLERQLDKTKQSIALRKYMVSPLRKLPTEILEIIFVGAHCSSGSSWSPFNMRRIPWAVGRVCSRWRQVALSSPKLWSSFSISIQLSASIYRKEMSGRETGTMGCQLRHGGQKIVEECLARSGQWPLTFHIKTEGSIRHTNVQAAQPLIQLISAIAVHRERWKDATFEFDSLDADVRSSVTKSLLSGIREGLPQLERLAWTSVVESLGKAFVETPRLEELEIPFPAGPNPISLPWSQLRKLTMLAEQDEVIKDIGVLKYCNQLVECDIACPIMDLPSYPRFSLQQLQILHCHPVVLDVFSSLPALQELSLCSIEDISSLSALIQRSDLQISTLVLEEAPTRTAEHPALVDVFGRLPRLDTLEFYFTPSTLIIDSLFIDPVELDRTLLPRLSHISFLSTDSDSHISRIFQMVETRMSILESLALRARSKMVRKRQVKDQLIALEARGLSILMVEL
ncbi:hypothetical protein C8J56DRAFT_988045 [Mycena floridula]|nr:hypothetical protein C8J56DRAFT_988045 [Mycena floridula]